MSGYRWRMSFSTVQIAIEDVETGMKVFFPMPDGREDIPFTVKAKKMSFRQDREPTVTLTSGDVDEVGGTLTITEHVGFLLRRVVRTI
jgi:hypothetical protein